MNPFSREELASFDRDGFVVVRSLYNASEVARISGWIDELQAMKPQAGREMVYFEDSLKEPGKRILSRIENFSDYHEGFKTLVQAPKMADRVAALLGDVPLLFKEKINFKMPGGVGFAPHQDIQPGWDDYAGYFISVLVTVDKSTVENGCLELSAGHHKKGMLGKKWEPLKPEELKGITFVQYPMEPGDVAFFDCFVPHQSAPNLTDKPRRNLYLTYNRLREGDSREKYFSDKRRSFPPDNEREPGKEYRYRV